MYPQILLRRLQKRMASQYRTTSKILIAKCVICWKSQSLSQTLDEDDYRVFRVHSWQLNLFWHNHPLPLSLDLGDLRHQKTDLIAIKLGDRGNAVNVSDEVFGCAQERFERWLTVAPPENVAVWRDDHFDQPGCGPVFSEQASEDRLEMIADLHGPELAGAVLPNVVGFTDGSMVGGH